MSDGGSPDTLSSRGPGPENRTRLARLHVFDRNETYQLLEIIDNAVQTNGEDGVFTTRDGRIVKVNTTLKEKRLSFFPRRTVEIRTDDITISPSDPNSQVNTERMLMITDEDTSSVQAFESYRLEGGEEVMTPVEETSEDSLGRLHRISRVFDYIVLS